MAIPSGWPLSLCQKHSWRAAGHAAVYSSIFKRLRRARQSERSFDGAHSEFRCCFARVQRREASMRRISFLLLPALSVVAMAVPARAYTWTTVAPLPESKSLLAGAAGGDGRIYAIGGTSDDGPPVNPRVYAYDPNLDSWTQVASLSSPRRNMAAATDLNGLIYVFGGYDFSGPPFALAIVERYDPSMGFWQRMTDMPTLRQSTAAATGADGRIYVMGGTNTSFQTTAVTEVYDPGTDSWSTAAPMNSPRTGFGAAAGPDGHIYVFGGYTGNAYADTAEVYDPATDTWAIIASMNQIRYSVAGTIGPDGLIYAIGGYNGRGDLSSVEVYDPNSDTWTLVASMTTARSGHAAALGLDGRICAFGGGTTSVEAYTP